MNKRNGQIRFFSLLILAILVNILSQTAHEPGHHLVYWGTSQCGSSPSWFKFGKRRPPIPRSR